MWMVLEHLSPDGSKEAKEQRFRNSENSEWGPIAAQTMCEATKAFPISFGGGKKTLGDIYEKTPNERIAKVMLEEKVFKTWYHGRTVLLGDGECYQDILCALKIITSYLRLSNIYGIFFYVV